MIDPKKPIFLLPFLALFLLSPACIGRAGVAAPSGQSPASVPLPGAPAQAAGISVQGEGSVSVVPDEAEVRLGVSVKALGLAEAQSDAAARMARVMDKLNGLGVPKERIRTLRYNISPQYGQNQVFTGYQVENMVSARTRALDKVGELLDAVVQAGSNRVESISFGVADPKPLAAKARDAAMADAKAKAEQLARLAGVKLGRPTSVSESLSGGPLPRFSPSLGEAFSAVTPISPGEMEIRVNVQVIYSIE